MKNDLHDEFCKEPAEDSDGYVNKEVGKLGRFQCDLQSLLGFFKLKHEPLLAQYADKMQWVEWLWNIQFMCTHQGPGVYRDQSRGIPASGVL